MGPRKAALTAPALRLFLFLLLAVATIGCSSSLSIGRARLPLGIDQAMVPNVQRFAYVYANAEPPLRLTTALFHPDAGPAENLELMPPRLTLRRATLVIGEKLDEFGGTLEFGSERDAGAAWSLFTDTVEANQVWGKLAQRRVLLARGAGPWADSARGALDSGRLVRLADGSPSWTLLTNLPEDPPARPIAVGVLDLDSALLDSLESLSGVGLEGLDDAFRLVRVDAVAFGVYTDALVDVPEAFDTELIRQTDAGVVFVSHSTYPGMLVSFLLGIAGGRTGMELIELQDTNARYRTFGDLHLIVKNKGSLVYAALASERSRAESLLVSALAE